MPSFEQHAKLVLKCKLCEYTPDPASTMGEFEMHFKLEHSEVVDSDGNPDIAMELLPLCLTHNTFLRFIESRPTGGGFKDYFYCPVDNAETFIKRGA